MRLLDIFFAIFTFDYGIHCCLFAVDKVIIVPEKLKFTTVLF